MRHYLLIRKLLTGIIENSISIWKKQTKPKSKTTIVESILLVCSEILLQYIVILYQLGLYYKLLVCYFDRRYTFGYFSKKLDVKFVANIFKNRGSIIVSYQLKSCTYIYK